MLEGYTKVNNKIVFLEKESIEELAKKLGGLVTSKNKEVAEGMTSYKVNKKFLATLSIK
jgi:hypothetical protein